MDEQKLAELERYTVSGNHVPVSRVTIPADDLRALIAEVRRADVTFSAILAAGTVDEWGKYIAHSGKVLQQIVKSHLEHENHNSPVFL